MNLFNEALPNSRIFKNESVFLPDYQPEVVGRDKEIKELVFNLKPIIYNRPAISSLLYGPPGTGKTTVAKYVASHLKSAKSNVHTIYINCWLESSRYAILSNIAKSLGYPVSRRGKAADEILSYISENSKKYIVLILDEVDMLGSKLKILYDLLRMKENYNIPVCLVSISNKLSFLKALDNRAKSSFISKTIYFEPYKIKQLKEILTERSKLGFFPGVCSDSAINMSAAIGAKYGGDARLAINLLWLAGKECERKDKCIIEEKDVLEVKDKALLSVKDEKEKFLTPEEKKILSLIREKKKIRSGELYKMLDMNDRTIRNYLRKLIDKDLITIIYSNPKEGNTRWFLPK